MYVPMALPSLGMVEPGVEGVEGVGRGRRIAVAVGLLAQVLAAGGLDQPVEGVVGVVVARLDALVAEVDGLLRVVVDVGDVAGGVVGVVQVLQPGVPGPAGDGAAAGQSPGKAAASRRVSRWVSRKVSGS